jgi:hypothetical protein
MLTAIFAGTLQQESGIGKFCRSTACRVSIFANSAEFRTAKGEALTISVPQGETAVLKHFQERMPCGLFVPDAP